MGTNHQTVQTSEHFALINTSENCRLQLISHTGLSLQSHFMSGHSLEPCQNETFLPQCLEGLIQYI